MNEKHAAEVGAYEIRLQGHLAPRWSAWFDGLELTRGQDGTTLLRGTVVDQAALHGLLQKVRDAGLPLVSVAYVGPDLPAAPRPMPDHHASTQQGETT